MKTAISEGISQIGQCLMTQHSEMPTLVQKQAKFEAARAPKVQLDNAVVAENDALMTLKVTCKGALDNLHDELCKSGGFVELLNDQRNADADQAAAEAAQEVINKLKDDTSLDFATTFHTEASLEKAQRMPTVWEYESAYKFGSGCNVLFHIATQQSNFAYRLGAAASGMPPCDIGHDFSLEELDGFCTSHTL